MTLRQLSDAIEEEDIDEIKRLMLESPNLVNREDGTGWFPIHSAIGLRSLELVKFLLEQNANVNVANGFGETPLHFAAKDGMPEFTKLLLENSADPEAKTTRNTGRCTPLYFAACRFNQSSRYVEPYREVAALLLSHGATLDANSMVLMGENEKLKALLAEKPNIYNVSVNNRELLRDAAAVRNVEGAKILLDYGLEPNASALTTAIRITEHERNRPSTLTILRMYLEAGAGQYLHAKHSEVPGTIYEHAQAMTAKDATNKVPDGFLELIEKHNTGE